MADIITFGKAVKSVDDISNESLSYIRKLYRDVAKDIKKEISKIISQGGTDTLRLQRLIDLERSAEREYAKITKDMEDNIPSFILAAATVIPNTANKWLGNFSVKLAGSFGHIPTKVVAELVNGSVYQKGWTFSKAIWGDNANISKTLQRIVADGIANGKSYYEIAKDLETYVLPEAKKPWNWGKVYPGSSKIIDYNAQRLVRTLINHAYQLSVREMASNNPFAEGIMWLSAFSRTTCNVCMERHGNIYSPEDLPLDHPNGKCAYAIVSRYSMTEIEDRLANWVNGAEDKELDRYAEYLDLDII